MNSVSQKVSTDGHTKINTYVDDINNYLVLGAKRTDATTEDMYFSVRDGRLVVDHKKNDGTWETIKAPKINIGGMKSNSEFTTYSDIVFFDIFSENNNKYSIIFDIGAGQIRLNKNDQTIKMFS